MEIRHQKYFKPSIVNDLQHAIGEAAWSESSSDQKVIHPIVKQPYTVVNLLEN